MSSALTNVFQSTSTWLSILKYLGLALAAGSSIWGTVNELTRKTSKGCNRLTFAGGVSIALTIVGLIISIASEDLQRRETSMEQSAQVAAEAKRTNAIIVAGQPLINVDFRWEFRSIGADLSQLLAKRAKDANAYIEDQQGERDGQQNGAVDREFELYPFLVALSRRLAMETKTDQPSDVVVLIELDEGPNALLPFGHLDKTATWGSASQTNKIIAERVPSLEVGSHGDLGNSDLSNWPSLRADATNATLAWRVDPATFVKSLARQNKLVVPTAKFPDTLRIAVLFDIQRLPFEPGNFAISESPDFWTPPDEPDPQQENFQGKLQPITKDFTSSVKIVPNNSTLVSYSYRLQQVYEAQFQDSYGEANSNLRCIVFEYGLQD